MNFIIYYTIIERKNIEKNLVIVVGGPGGSGSSTISKMLAEHFGLERIYGGQIMRDLVAEKGYDSFESFYKGSNEAALLSFDKEVDDNVSAATINTSGYLKCRATHVGEDTTLSQIIKMVCQKHGRIF